MINRDDPELEELPLPYELALAWHLGSRHAWAAYLQDVGRKALGLMHGGLVCKQDVAPAV